MCGVAHETETMVVVVDAIKRNRVKVISSPAPCVDA